MTPADKLERLDLLNKRCAQGAAVADLIGKTSTDDTLRDNTLPNAAWLLADLFDEIGQIAGDVVR